MVVSNNLIKNKSFTFALSIIELYKMLKVENDYIISKQLLRFGTSINANIEEGLYRKNRTDFVAKLSIFLKEACKTLYWLELLKVSKLIKIDLSKYIKDLNKIISISILNIKKIYK